MSGVQITERKRRGKTNFASLFSSFSPDFLIELPAKLQCTLRTLLWTSSIFQYISGNLATPSLSSFFSVTCVGCHMDAKCAWDSTAAGAVEPPMPRKWAPAGLKNASSEAQHRWVDARLFW